MQINIKQFKKWIAALDSGEYRQGGGALQLDFGYCPIGVGCMVTIPKELLYINHEGRLGGGVAEDQPAAPQWLIDIDDDFYQKTGTGLMCLNDDKAFTFPEIATLLELVYVHKILD
jgi:hypothetical protein